MNSSAVAVAILALILLAAGLYVYQGSGVHQTQPQPQQPIQTMTVTQTVANTTITTTTTMTQTQTEIQYSPSTGTQLSFFKINYYAKGSTDYNNVMKNAVTSLCSSSCTLPLAVIDPQWPSTKAANARGEVVFSDKCSFSNLSSGTYGVKVCVVGTPVQSASIYTTSNTFPKIAIVDGVLVVGDARSINTYKLPCPTTKKTDIYIYRINGSAYDTLRVTVDCCGVTAVTYNLNTQMIIPLQSLGIELPVAINTYDLMIWAGAAFLLIAAYIYFKPRRRGRR